MAYPDSPAFDSVDPGDKEAEERQDIELMLRVKEGDVEAFRLLVVKYQSPIVGTVTKMLGGASDSEDIAQQVFVRVWKSSARYEPQAKFSTWIFTIAKNLVFNEMRRRRRKPTVSSDEREEEFHQPVEDGSTLAPDASLLSLELERAVDAAIQSLPEKQRLAVVMRRYEELPYEEIAQVLSMSVPAVKSLLFRARTQLREVLQRYLKEG